MPIRATAPKDASVTTVNQIVADNIRACRQLGRLEQADVAERMTALGHPWHRATVSETERSRRNVTVSELMALTLVLHTTVAQLLDPRGPAGRTAVRPIFLSFDPDAPSRMMLSAEQLAMLVTPAAGRAEITWNEDRIDLSNFTDGATS